MENSNMEVNQTATNRMNQSPLGAPPNLIDDVGTLEECVSALKKIELQISITFQKCLVAGINNLDVTAILKRSKAKKILSYNQIEHQVRNIEWIYNKLDVLYGLVRLRDRKALELLKRADVSDISVPVYLNRLQPEGLRSTLLQSLTIIERLSQEKRPLSALSSSEIDLRQEKLDEWVTNFLYICTHTNTWLNQMTFIDVPSLMTQFRQEAECTAFHESIRELGIQFKQADITLALLKISHILDAATNKKGEFKPMQLGHYTLLTAYGSFICQMLDVTRSSANVEVMQNWLGAQLVKWWYTALAPGHNNNWRGVSMRIEQARLILAGFLLQNLTNSTLFEGHKIIDGLIHTDSPMFPAVVYMNYLKQDPMSPLLMIADTGFRCNRIQPQVLLADISYSEIRFKDMKTILLALSAEVYNNDQATDNPIRSSRSDKLQSGIVFTMDTNRDLTIEYLRRETVIPKVNISQRAVAVEDQIIKFKPRTYIDYQIPGTSGISAPRKCPCTSKNEQKVDQINEILKPDNNEPATRKKHAIKPNEEDNIKPETKKGSNKNRRGANTDKNVSNFSSIDKKTSCGIKTDAAAAQYNADMVKHSIKTFHFVTNMFLNHLQVKMDDAKLFWKKNVRGKDTVNFQNSTLRTECEQICDELQELIYAIDSVYKQRQELHTLVYDNMLTSGVNLAHIDEKNYSEFRTRAEDMLPKSNKVHAVLQALIKKN